MKSMTRVRALPLELVESNGLSFLRAPHLGAIPGLEHAFMGRAGGVSPAPFNSLNFGGDDGADNVRANKELLGRAFTLPSEGVFTVKQVHGSDVFVIKDRGFPYATRPSADAIITAEANVPIGILTADCVPVLLYDPASKTVAAAHAGWRGLTAGVLQETLAVLSSNYAVSSRNILAAIGPHIGPCCYEVSDDLVSSFKDAGLERGRYFIRDESGLRLDLGAAAADVLASLGVPAKNISPPGPCTACNRALYYSYRRDGVTGRQLSFIMKR